jgi:hypothetical protein
MPVLLASATVSSATASVVFSSIPATYKSLRLLWSSATNAAATWTNAAVRFNGDTGSNYYFQGGSTTYTSAAIGYHAGATTYGAAFSSNDCFINDYASATRRKWISGLCIVDTSSTATPTIGAGWYYNYWAGTAAINSVTIIDFNGNNIVSGSTFCLYGYP